MDSFKYAKKHFSNRTLLVPDMAFCMNDKYLDKWSKNKPQIKLFSFKERTKRLHNRKLNLTRNPLIYTTGNQWRN